MSEIASIKATVRFSNGFKVQIESRPGADSAKAIGQLREILDNPKGGDQPSTTGGGVPARTTHLG